MRKFIAGALIAGATLPLLAGVATAASHSNPSPDAGGRQAKCATGVDARLAELTKLDRAVAAAKHLADGHRTTITSNNAAARSGLTDLKAKIAADTDDATRKADCKSVVVDYRVSALRAPQEHLVIAADAESAAIAKLQGLGGKVPAELQAKVADAATQINGLADAVLATTPADYNANHDVLKASRASVKAAAADLKEVRAGMKAAKPPKPEKKAPKK